MRNFLAVLLLSCCSFASNGQKWRPGQPSPHKPGTDYPIKIHIYGIHLPPEYYGSEPKRRIVYADATMDSKKIELCFYLEFAKSRTEAVLPGGYRARLLEDSPKTGPYKVLDPLIDRKYELVMPDGHFLTSTVTGVSE